ncbi:MAG: hypothetical protein KDA41_00865 [Planctomycetales bacterium]|nr:hypothetical protein [Planctomycetales bacterium]
MRKTFGGLFRKRLSAAIAGLLLVLACGCLRGRHTADEAAPFRDDPAMPKVRFPRAAEAVGQFGLDPRSREIERSLGVE